MTKKRLFFAVVLALLIADQAVNYTVLRDGRLFGFFVAPYDPPLFTWPQLRSRDTAIRIAAGDEELRALSTIDPELGWAPPRNETAFGAHFDVLGARISVREHALEKGAERRILAMGGSFTLGAEVKEHEAWASRIEEACPQVEILNLGVSAYGMDQAYLRFLRRGAELDPDEVWFGLLPAASPRVSTHFGPASQKWVTAANFKPRFLPLDGGGLRLVANPAPSHAEAARLLTDQRAFFDALVETDLWVARSPAAFAPRGSHPSHWFTTSRLLVTAMESGDRALAPWLEDSDSEIYRTLRELLLAFDRGARDLGAEFKVLVLPAYSDLHARADAGRAFWQPLIDDVAAEGIECFDLSDALVAAGALEEEGCWALNWHYSPHGNRVVAEAIRERWLAE